MNQELTPPTTQVAQGQAYQIKEKLANLERLLNEKAPGIAVLLRDIHTILKKDSELVTILSEQECNILVRGLEKQTSTNIAAAALKSGTSGKKALSKMTVNDL